MTKRIMKKKSERKAAFQLNRLLEKMDTNLSRSSTGTPVSAASSSTRWLKRSQLSSLFWV